MTDKAELEQLIRDAPLKHVGECAARGYCTLYCRIDRAALTDAVLKLWEKEQKDIAPGFGELTSRLYNDQPILPYSGYSQDVAFVAFSLTRWREEAVKRGARLTEHAEREKALQQALARHERLYQCATCRLILKPVIVERATLPCPDCKTDTALPLALAPLGGTP